MEQEIFREAVLAYAREVCGMWKVGGGQVRKGREWWDDEVKLLVTKNEVCVCVGNNCKECRG